MASHQSPQHVLPNKPLATIQTLHLDAGPQIEGQQLANASASSNIHKDVINQATSVMKVNYALQRKTGTANGFLQIDGAVDVEENQGLKNDSDSKEKRKGMRKRGWNEMMDTNTEEPQTVFYNAAAGEQVHGDANRWRVKRAKVTEMNKTSNKNTSTAIKTKTKPTKGNKAKSEGPSENIEEESLCDSWEYETASEDANEEGEDADDEEEDEDDYGEQAEEVEEEEMKERAVERAEELEQEAEIEKLVVKMSVEEKVEKWRETLLVRSSRGKRQRA